MLDLLKKRRSIRKYRPESLGQEEVARLAMAALLSPSSRNRRPWEFILVTDRELLAQLALSKSHGSSFLKDAALGVVVLGDPEKSDVWVEDCSIAALLLHLTAASMDLGSCWIQIRQRPHSPDQMAGDYIKELLAVPDKYEVEAMIAVGYPAEDKTSRGEEGLDFSKVYADRFGSPWHR